MITALVSIYFIINIAMLMIFAHELYPMVSDWVLLEIETKLKKKKRPDVYAKIVYIIACIFIVLLGLPFLLFHLLKESVNNHE